MIRSRSTVRLLAAAGALALSIACIALSVPAARAESLARSSAVAAGDTCAPGATCVTIPVHCPKAGTCPTVTAEPTTQLASNQWIFVSLSDFPVGSTAEIYLCENKAAITDARPPHCVLEGTPALSYPNQELPIGSGGTGTLSFQTIDDPHVPADKPLVGLIPGESSAPPVDFYCGDSADPCSVDVVDPSVLSKPPTDPVVPLPTDTAVVPLGFAPESRGCPKAATVFTYSDFSIEELLPHESPVACAEANPAIPVDTAASTALTLPSLASGSVAFVDDPQATALAAAVKKYHYAVVPIVASAVVMGYVAAMGQNEINWPFNSFELTPNEVAGIITYNYQGPYNADLVKCSTGTCSAMEELNSVPGFVAAGEYASFIPSEETGVTQMITDWVCHAPNVPFLIDGTEIHDPNLAAKTYTRSVDYPKTWPLKACDTIDQFPPLPSPSVGLYNMASGPSYQVKYLRAFAPPPQFQLSPVAAFTPIDWGDARFNGLDTASLQNAEGEFVAPTPQAVQAEVSAEPLAKGGYPLPAPTLKVRNGYPLATVIDALVPDYALATSQAKPISEMLHELLNYTTSTADLPDGYVALPSKLASAAQHDLNQALVAEGAPTSLTTTTTLAVSPPDTSAGEAVTFSAKVSAAAGTPTGDVSVDLGFKVLCSVHLVAGAGSCSSSALPDGSDVVNADYLGTTGFDSSVGTSTVDVSTAATPTTVATNTTPTGSVPSTKVTPTTATPKSPSGHAKARSAAGYSIADVTLAGATARLALPVALAAGGLLVVMSLLLTLIGHRRRRRPESPADA